MHNPLKISNTSTMPRYFWHPSVVYVPEGLGGHKWWMAQTPFPPCEFKPYRDRYELPCVHYSDDGVQWFAIEGNPIDDINAEQEKKMDFMSDPHLIFKGGCLELYYRLSIRVGQHETNTLLLRKKSKDGFNWSDREIIADLREEKDAQIWGEQIISQSLIWTGEEYLCWYVDGSWYKKDRGVRLVQSKDGVQWEKLEICAMDDYQEQPWHIDVQKVEGVYHMLCYYYESDVLRHLTSKDGAKWENGTQVLTHAKSLMSFYSSKTYRSCMVSIDKVYYIYFSAATSYRSYIGLIKTTDWRNFEPIGPAMNMRYMMDIPITLVRKLVRKIGKMLK